MSVSTANIKLLRESTGAGILDCKKALQETQGNIEAAVEFLRKKGLASAAKKTSREANDGLVQAYISEDGNVGVLLEINCETDFVARTDDFQEVVDSLAELVAQNSDLTSAEKLLAAPSPADSSKTVAEYITETIAKLGENIVLRRVVRYSSEDNNLLDSYIHMGGRVGVLVEASNGTNRDQALEILHDVALQIAAIAPQYTRVEDIPNSVIEAEKAVYRAQLADDKKPADIKERIIDGKLKKWYSQVVLLEQEFVKDSSLTVAKLLKQHGDQFQIRRFARFELGAE